MKPQEKKAALKVKKTGNRATETTLAMEKTIPAAENSAPAAQIIKRPIITLITDFGEGYYGGAVKGAILDICPDAHIIDITHDIGSYDVLGGAFTLLCTYPYYPKGSIHVVVVDPGVGSGRRGIIVSTKDYYFVGPDNGVFSFVFNREPVEDVISIDSPGYFRKQVSATFHGRDVFGPVAAWLAKGTELDEFGEKIQDYTGTALLPVEQVGKNRLEGIVIHVDKFGNVITSMSPDQVFDLLGEAGVPKFFLNGQEISHHCRFYAEAARGQIFSLVGSSGYYEIAAHRKRAADILGVERGAKVELELVKD
ncbi:SAM-dependent chlorinase/fluorinase [Acidobacteria bacterium AH-259-O06]|nr:SAM-dependent chlorinase/fluorinase [Acidobacteria bacterium AH-259-O06]